MATTNFKGTPVTLSGTELTVGDNAPEIIIVGGDLEDIVVGGAKDKVQLIVSVPSLDTATCAAETRRFNVEVGSLDICTTTVVSMDLPFASAKFCSTEGIDNLEVGSDYVEKEFAKSYGVLMADNKLKGLCARAIFVVNRDGIITYKQIVPEVTDEPIYEEILEAIKDAR
ncbi:MAG: thiol peroxidase [Campylobacterota bacterium]|nr:thiol peroxidase [Campylobacterota bacterium]